MFLTFGWFFFVFSIQLLIQTQACHMGRWISSMVCQPVKLQSRVQQVLALLCWSLVQSHILLVHWYS